MPSEDNKRIAKNTLFLYFRMLINLGIGLYTSRIVIAALGIEDFGIYNVVGGIVVMFGFLSGPLSAGTQRFISYELGKNDLTKLKQTFSAALNIHILLAIVIVILAETIGLWFLIHKINIPLGREIAAMCVYQFSIFTMVISVIQIPFESSIIAHERMNIFAYFSIIDVVWKLLIAFLLSISMYDKLITYAVLYFLVCFVMLGIYRIYCRKQFSEYRFALFYDKPLYQSLLSFSGWNILGCGAVVGATQGVNILLNIFFTPAINAARGVAVLVNSAVSAFVNNFQTAINPQIVKLYAAGKVNELYTLIFQNAKFSFCIMWILLLPISLQLETILKIWLAEVPENTALFCRLILLQSLVSSVQRPFVMTIHALGKMKILNLTAGIILLSVLPISYFLLKAGALSYTPFLIYILASILEFICELFLLTRWINLPISTLFKNVFIPQLLIVACSFPVSVFVCYYFPFIIAILFSGLSVCISVYFIAFSKETRVKTVNKVKNKVFKNLL